MTNRTGPADLSRKRSGHERVLAAIKHSLAEGRYEGGMLPSYRQLVKELDVTMANVERAMAELEREGLVRRVSGRGTLSLPQNRPATPSKPHPLQCINILGYSLATMPSFVEADYLTGYTEALDYSRVPIRMRFISGNELNSRNKRLFSPMLPMAAQGVILINSCPPELMDQFRRNNVPFVVQYFARYVSKALPPHSSVYVNKTRGAYQAVNHLLDLGHRDIGFMGPVNPDISLEEVVYEGYRAGAECIFEGYRAALACAGKEYTKDNIANDDCATREKQTIFSVAKAFLDRPRRPTAVLASCDEFAVALLKAARALSLRVPEDLSIVGFDNQPGSEQTDPPLTTVSVPRRELAKSAVELLLEVADNPGAPPQTRMPETHLIIRETTAPLRAANIGNSANSLPAQS